MIKRMPLSVAALVVMVLGGCGEVLDVPTNVTVTDTSPITLTWTAVTGATSYKIYRSTETGTSASKTLLASGITVTTYSDTSTSSGTTYYYQVVAVSSDGVSSASSEVSATAGSSTDSFVVVGTVASSQITLTWSTISGAVSYNVYRGTTSAVVTNKTEIKSGVTTTTCTDTGVTSGVTYYYQVTAVNSSGVEFQVSSETPALSF